MARNYKKFDIYHLAYQFVLDIYELVGSFPSSEEHNISSQLKRAAVSIPLNIAEGSAKSSSKEFRYFLNVAYASAKEVEVLLSLSKDLQIALPDKVRTLEEQLDTLNAKLFKFLRSVEQQVPSKKFHFFRKFENSDPR